MGRINVDNSALWQLQPEFFSFFCDDTLSWGTEASGVLTLSLLQAINHFWQTVPFLKKKKWRLSWDDVHHALPLHAKFSLRIIKSVFLLSCFVLTPGALLPWQQSIQRTNEYACFTQVVCEPVPISYQQARWVAGQMAPNDVTSCFNKTLEGRAASLSSNKDYYAIYFLSLSL